MSVHGKTLIPAFESSPRQSAGTCFVPRVAVLITDMVWRLVLIAGRYDLRGCDGREVYIAG